MPASYAISVRRAGVLPAASFRFRVAPDTLAVRLTVPTIRVRRGLAPPSHKSATIADSMGLAPHAPCRAHQKKSPQDREDRGGLKREINFISSIWYPRAGTESIPGKYIRAVIVASTCIATSYVTVTKCPRPAFSSSPCLGSTPRLPI